MIKLLYGNDHLVLGVEVITQKLKRKIEKVEDLFK